MSYRRLHKKTYYFGPINPPNGRFVIQFVGESPRDYTMSHTYKECVEDYCDRMGYKLHQMLTQMGTYRGHGQFEYYKY